MGPDTLTGWPYCVAEAVPRECGHAGELLSAAEMSSSPPCAALVRGWLLQLQGHSEDRALGICPLPYAFPLPPLGLSVPKAAEQPASTKKSMFRASAPLLLPCSGSHTMPGYDYENSCHCGVHSVCH